MSALRNQIPMVSTDYLDWQCPMIQHTRGSRAEGNLEVGGGREKAVRGQFTDAPCHLQRYAQLEEQAHGFL